jgi:hypothetical protein
MWMHPYVEGTLIRERIAEARREGARRQLLHSAKPPTAPRRPRAVMQQFVEAISTLWLKARKEVPRLTRRVASR